MDRSKYLDAFIEEARESLEVVNGVLLSLEERGFDEGQMNEAFRVVHTIKGTAGVVGAESVSELAHVMEDLFDVLRKRREAPDKETLQLLFTGVDRIERMLDDLEKGVPSGDAKDLMARMTASTDAKLAASPAGEARPSAMHLSPEQREQVATAVSSGGRAVEVKCTFSPGLKLREGRAYQVVKALSALGSVVTTSPPVSDMPDTQPGFAILLVTRQGDEAVLKAAKGITGIASAEVSELPGTGADAGKGAVDARGETAEEKGPLTTGSTIRVRSKLLDQLLDLVGEIMINNIRINQIAADLKHRELKQSLQNNSRLMGELQDIVLRTRMVPVDFIFKRFPRIVRDMAQANGKEIEFVMRGNDIEIDRSLLDEIGDALVHLLRNAADHGIEPKEERLANGKRPQGTICLSAFREQGNIVITVEDDGRGMDLKKITAKAISKGLITAEEAERMDDRAKLQFIFLPGFSTAEKVSDISGRGVGMDVVKTKIESLGGVVRLDTAPGKGSRITLKLPPSMSIIRAMLVEINSEKYAIPLENVLETVRVPRDAVHEIGERGVFRLRDEVLPILNIHSEFGGRSEAMPRDMPAIIVEKNDSRACLIVSRLIGQQEIVVKNLGKDLRSAGYFSGATILGDGKVAMILDVGAII